jgi:hypothetical protein
MANRPIDAVLRGLASKGGVKAAYVAFSAAEILAPAVRQPRQWLMVSPERAEEVVRQIEAKPADSGDNLVLLIPPDDEPLFDAAALPRPSDMHKPGANPCGCRRFGRPWQ